MTSFCPFRHPRSKCLDTCLRLLGLSCQTSLLHHDVVDFKSMLLDEVVLLLRISSTVEYDAEILP